MSVTSRRIASRCVMLAFVCACASAGQQTVREERAPSEAPLPARTGASDLAAPAPNSPSAFTSKAGSECAGICAKLLECKHGPWDVVEDCLSACEASSEDETSGETYHCVAKSGDCEQVRRCGS